MYLCVCQAIREGCLAELRQAGGRPRRARELFLALGKRPQCGVCLRHIQGRLDALARADQGLSLAGGQPGHPAIGGAERERAA